MSVEFDKVVKRYGATEAVAGISFTVELGTLVTLLGPSGCGKTTTLRMIAGLELPSAGRILIAGRDVTDLGATQRDVSMVFQSYALFPHMSVLENVCYGLRRSGLGREEAAKRAREGLATVGLAGYDARQPSELSGGQQQRVAVARALVLKPSVLLFDEPLSNLDARLRRQMREEIRELQQRLGLTVVYVTHDQQEAMAVSDRIIVMNAGRIEQQGSPRELYERPGDALPGALHGRIPSSARQRAPRGRRPSPRAVGRKRNRDRQRDRQGRRGRHRRASGGDHGRDAARTRRRAARPDHQGELSRDAHGVFHRHCGRHALCHLPTSRTAAGGGAEGGAGPGATWCHRRRRLTALYYALGRAKQRLLRTPTKCLSLVLRGRAHSGIQIGETKRLDDVLDKLNTAIRFTSPRSIPRH